MADRLVVFFFILTLLSCKGGLKVDNKIPPESSSARDSAFIFNGSSLEGWEIANFGPQGPVYVSGENVILGMGEGCTGITYKNKFPEIN
jgi:hypothetical protein